MSFQKRLLLIPVTSGLSVIFKYPLPFEVIIIPSGPHQESHLLMSLLQFYRKPGKMPVKRIISVLKFLPCFACFFYVASGLKNLVELFALIVILVTGSGRFAGHARLGGDLEARQDVGVLGGVVRHPVSLTVLFDAGVVCLCHVRSSVGELAWLGSGHSSGLAAARGSRQALVRPRECLSGRAF